MEFTLPWHTTWQIANSLITLNGYRSLLILNISLRSLRICIRLSVNSYLRVLFLLDHDSSCSPEKNIWLLINQSFMLRSIGYPIHKVPNLDCVWIATAPDVMTVVIKFHVLDLQDSMEAMTIGLGDDPQERLAIIFKSWEASETPPPIFTSSRSAWIRYATHIPDDKTPKGFLIEILGTYSTGMLFLISDKCQV